MTSSESTDSPFASPKGADFAVQKLIGEEACQALRYLQLVYIAMALQLGTVVAIPLVAALSAMSAENSSPARWTGFAVYSWLVVLYLFSAYSLLRLMLATKSHLVTMVAYCFFALCPCIGLFALLPVAETIRDSLERQGIPFRRTGPNWNALREMAADLPPDDEDPSVEDPQ
ncbi:hypothetical protein [Bremerella sp. P1]|uniref:hypothetical protein n=1 Tax=Bremerella sp. P1 TaxID=3026424 RepID=UPI002367F81F|nr:hypothetical protein [Bremerella sp. P1]WDI44666.1 hypothetical protein PSR63_12040 [Bremerella sp. P1]